MKLEDVKRDFIGYMEEIHGGNPYPRNFLGCIMAISSEDEPVSQDRIMDLTGYSQATVSITLQKIQLLLSVRQIKKKADRKNYYVYDDAANSFVLDLLQRRVDVQDVDIGLVDSVLEKISNWPEEDRAVKSFRIDLENMRLYLSLIHEIRSESVKPFKLALAAGTTEYLNLQKADELADGALSEFLLNLKKASSNTETALNAIKDKTSSHLLLLKNEYFTGIKTYLNPLFSQAIANQLAVVHCVLVERNITQNRIEQVTQLPRSTISEVLSIAVRRGIVGASGSRPKYYRPSASFSDLMLASFDRVANYIVQVIKRLGEFKTLTRRVRPKSKDAAHFLKFLSELEIAYSLAHSFSINMKVKTVGRLKEKFEAGFVFI